MKYFVKQTVLVLIVIILTSFIQVKLFANSYYASSDGTGIGTLASPCSFTSGLSKLSAPGDTLYLRGGIYNLTAKVSINETGTITARIAIMAYPGEKPILDFSGQPYASTNPGISLSSSSSYMHIKGLVIRYAGDNGMINNGSNHIIENCEFYGNCDSGLQHKDGGNNLILNCDSHHNFDYQSGGIGAADFGGNADGFADKQFSNSKSNTYEGCRAWNNSDDGWDFFQRVGSTVIKNSICYNNGPQFYNMTNHPRYLTDKAWFDQFPRTVNDADGGTPTVTLSSYINYGNGNGFKLGGDYTVHDVTLIRCLAVGNTVRGFDQNNNYGTMTVTNASAYLNETNYGFGTQSGGTLIIKNSVSLNSVGGNSFNAKYVTNANNSWNTSGIICNSSDFTSLDTTLILSPRNTNGSYTTTFMNLVTGSDLIDAGVLAGIPYAGNAPDLGYNEYGTIDKFPAAVSATANKTQMVVIGNPITNIVFTWSGSATDLNATGLPDGVIAITNSTNKTLTLQGTPTTIGSYQYTVTSTSTTDAPITITGQISASSVNAKKIAYFTTVPTLPSDDLIVAKLNSNPDFFVTTVNSTSTTTDYSGYDLIVMSSTPASGDAGFPSLESVNKPKLLLKPFTLKNTVWNWINPSAVNTTQTGVTISDKTHQIFSGLSFSGINTDELQLFSSVNTNGVTGVTNSAWLATPGVTVLGNAIGMTTTNSIVEIPVGTNMNGTTTTQRFVMIGISEFSTANLTTTATQLIENTCYYLLGLNSPLSTKPISASKKYSLTESNNMLYINGSDDIQHISLHSVSGTCLKQTKNTNEISTLGLNSGVYIILITDKSGAFVEKFLKIN